MNTSTNYGFNLPSRDSDDIVDINLISDNFNKLDEILYELQNIKKFDLTTNFAYAPVPIAGGVATTLRNNNDIIAVATSTGIAQISYPVKFEDGNQETWTSNVVFQKITDTETIANWIVNYNDKDVNFSLLVGANGLLEITASVASSATSSALPNVSTEDNGKLLQVVDGVWSAVTIPNGNEVEY